MVRADHAVARVDGGSLDNRQNVALHAFAGHIRAVPGFASGNFVDFIDEDDAHLFGALNSQARYLIHIQQLVFFFLDQIVKGFRNRHFAALLLLAENSGEHVLDVNVHFLDALVRDDFKRGCGALTYFHFHQALVQLAVTQLGAKLLPGAVHLLGARRFDARRGNVLWIGRWRKRRSGEQQIEYAIFRRMFGALRYLIQFLFAHHVNGRLDQIAHHRLHITAHVADFRVLGSLYFYEGTAGETREAPRDFRFAHAGWPNHQNIFGEHIFGHFGREFLAAHAISKRHGNSTLRGVLPDNVLVKLDHNFARGEFVE